MAQLKSTSIIGNLSVTGKINTTNDIVAPNIPEFIIGSGTTDSSAKTSTWTGASNQISEYRDGLTIKYKIGVVGQSTVTLNINGLGAKTVYRFNDTKLTTHFPVGSIITLVYHEDLNDGCWITNDYDANTNTYQRVYETSTDKEYAITARYNQTDGSTYYAEYGRYTNGVTLNPSKNSITATTFIGTLDGTANQVKTALTFSNAGSGAASGTTYNGSTARTISYNSIGALQDGSGDLAFASGTGWSSLSIGKKSNNGILTLYKGSSSYLNLQVEGTPGAGTVLKLPAAGGTVATQGWVGDNYVKLSECSNAGNRASGKVVTANGAGQINTEKLALTSGATVKATWKYNSTTDCVELAW